MTNLVPFLDSSLGVGSKFIFCQHYKKSDLLLKNLFFVNFKGLYGQTGTDMRNVIVATSAGGPWTMVGHIGAVLDSI